jgi:hypothetical protein
MRFKVIEKHSLGATPYALCSPLPHGHALFTLFSLLFSLYSFLFTLFSLLFTLYSLLCSALCSAPLSAISAADLPAAADARDRVDAAGDVRRDGARRGDVARRDAGRCRRDARW